MSLDYAPDFPKNSPGIITAMAEWFPTVNDTYKQTPVPLTDNFSSPGPEVTGSALVKTKSGQVLIYAGTGSKIYQGNGATSWTDRSGTSYSASDTWQFAQFGDITLAANGNDFIQQATGIAFSDIATSPKAKIVFIHENGVIAANTSADPAGWYRSDTGDPTNWTATAANDVDSGTLAGGVGGPITAGTVLGNLAILWKSSAMYGGLFVGDVDEKIRWQMISPKIGCVGINAFIETELGIIFVSERDVMLFDGSRPRSIADKIRKALITAINSNRKNVFLTHDEIERCVYIWYPTGSDTYPTRAIIYNYRTGKWGARTSVTSTTVSTTYLRCPVQNSNYTDMVATGGIATNPFRQANFAWGSGAGGRLLNFAYQVGSATRPVAPSMSTGYIGRPDQDSTLVRLRIINENVGEPVATFAGFSYNSTLNVSKAYTGGIDQDGNGNTNINNRFFRADLTWPTSASVTGDAEIRDLIPEYSSGSVPASGAQGGRR